MANNRPPDTKTLLNLLAIGAAAPSQWMSMEGYRNASYTVRVTCTAAITGGQLVLRGTNFAPQDAGCPAVLSFAAADAPAAAGGFALSGTTGVLAFAPTGAGTYIASFNATQFPKFLQAEVLAGSGGGTVSISVTLAGW